MTTLDLARAKPIAGPPPNLAGMTRAQLQAALVEAQVCAPDKARMRTNQLWRWIHHAGHTDFERMSDIDKATRSRLSDAFVLSRPQIVERQVSKDGTRKWLLRTAPGIEIEAV
ncbi:MAG: rlmN, partial [Caulobacteraceae bacterium]|nr:rlmN [Caulobacteraceae bacterium]